MKEEDETEQGVNNEGSCPRELWEDRNFHHHQIVSTAGLRNFGIQNKD